MDRVTDYRDIVKRIISEYAALKPSYGDIEVETIFDDGQGHYEMVYTGWNGFRRIHGAVLHVDIRDGKVWIQHDGTEDGIAEEPSASRHPARTHRAGISPPGAAQAHAVCGSVA